jgi:ABC-2 type transport system ATP-binding protein
VDIPTGRLVALVGPQGAGKTTFLNILAGLATPSCGHAWIADRQVRPGVKHSLGAFIDTPAFYPSLSGRRNLEVLATVGQLNTDKVDACITLLDLTPVADDAYRTYTMGYRQRLAIAGALLGSPALVLLDEPANGLDPVAAQELYVVLHSLVDAGATVIMATHLLDAVERHCDWTVVLDRGQLAWHGETPKSGRLLELLGGGTR